MQLSHWRLAPIGALLLALAACESSDKPIWIGESDNGKTIAAATGDELKIKIYGNPTTGYSWNAAPLTTNVLVQTSADYEADSDTPGSGGFYYFTYKAEQVGTSAVSLVYNRVFYPGELPANTFQVTIAVQ
jgi:predicted secreted protein